eukprot:TRINITY_DN34606_c0_g1_i1.p1 TRINITY_DN34606_c0_g1~~TRINITY_DN34606_c0_g1_i1.p1  ORF type:complete len:196 (-),score=18.33 TRINITY_DN34606_c0_g1_i1:159-746(-)
MPEGEKPQVLKGGRATLPGIPSSYTRVQGELIWARKCDEELEYIQERTDHPPRGRKKLGKLVNFELVKYPSYVNVRHINSPRESNCSAIQSVVTGLGPTRLSQLSASAPSLAIPPASSLSQRPPSPQGSNLSACPSSAPGFKMPKYQNHSCEWMRYMEGAARNAASEKDMNPSVRSLHRAIKALDTKRPAPFMRF